MIFFVTCTRAPGDFVGRRRHGIAWQNARGEGALHLTARWEL